MIIKPTVGRIVDYHPGHCDMTWRQDPTQPFAAQVVYVLDDRLVNLAGYDHAGVPFRRSSVVLMQDGDPVPSGSYCSWMQYQKDQAAKHANAEVPMCEQGAKFCARVSSELAEIKAAIVETRGFVKGRGL